MSFLKDQNQINFLKLPKGLLFFAFFLLFGVFLSALLINFLELPPAVIAPGVAIGPFAVGNLTEAQAINFLANQTNDLEERGLPLIFNNQTAEFKSLVGDPSNLELAYQVFEYQIEESVAAALKVGRNGRLAEKLKERLLARFLGARLPLIFIFDEEVAKQFLKDQFAKFETNSQEAKLLAVFYSEPPNSFEVKILSGVFGSVLPYEEIISQIKYQLINFTLTPIILRLVERPVKVTEADAYFLKEKFEAVIKRGDLNLFYKEKTFVIPAATLANWLVIIKENPQVPAHLDLSAEQMFQDLKDIVATMERPARSRKMEIIDGKVKEFQPAQTGLAVNRDELYQRVKSAVFDDLTSERGERVEIIAEKIEPAYQTDISDDLGIKELIGAAKTNFSGSPTNRRLNIKQGAMSLNGILIPPNEVFSTLQALGEIDKEHGYRSELVIKKDKTIPEFGGGLCQVSTTLFRSTLAAGLPIVERQNHSYRVRYYEPAGMDATIYSPRPDFKFLNDTGHYILIQTSIKGDELIFEFWGTKDGRLTEATKPRIYNLVAPPKAKLIATTDLPVGKKKCLESAHAGADTFFSYSIKYPNGTIKKQDFRSRYKPWGEVCLIGVASSTLSSANP